MSQPVIVNDPVPILPLLLYLIYFTENLSFREFVEVGNFFHSVKITFLISVYDIDII